MIGEPSSGLAAPGLATFGSLVTIAIGLGQSAPPRLDDLPDVPGATMHMKYEKTFLKVDVLTLAVRVDPATAEKLAQIRGEGSSYERNLEPPVAEAVRAAPETIAEIQFLRHIGLDQFLGGIDKDMSKAERAGWIDRPSYESIREGLPGWFAPLSARGIEKGDRLLYHTHGDTLRTTYVTRDGKTLVDQTDVGRMNVLALLGGYYAPDTSFRRKLIRSLWEPPAAPSAGPASGSHP